MNANELMIGDWVQIVEDAPIMSCECHQIDWIRTGELGLDNRKVVTYPYIKSIPLTVEILEKNGWKKEDVFGSLIKYRFTGPIDIETGGEMFRLSNNYFFCSGIHHVHELQHALRMCGVEKEITI